MELKDVHHILVYARMNLWRRKPLLWYKEQARQCKYNVTLRRVRTTIVAVEKQWVLRKLNVCICSLRYPAGNAHAPYCHLWAAPLCNVFPHFLINGTIFDKTVTEHKMCVLDFLYNFFWNISRSKRNERDMIKNVYWSSCKVTVVLVRL